ncbi:MAG: FAD-dependent oxidoreductase, partial [Clostridia bacterium]|nr:FAD-dependent oxidoreductase [Clostridia bacterium]
GISMLEGLYYCKELQKAGVDAIEVLAGIWSSEAGKSQKPESAYADCMAVALCLVMKIGLALTAGGKKITLIGGGRAQNPVASEKALKSGQCDLIFIGHGLLAQPDLVNLIDQDREDEIRPCIGCGHCIDHQLQHGARAVCSGNAVLARGDNDHTIISADIKKKVVVIGAGVAGVEAARIAAMRGHTVDIYDSANEVGGQMNLACKPPFKQHLGLMKPYLEKQLELHGVNVHLGKKMTKEDVLALNPDAVVCATGVINNNLPVEGGERAINAIDILNGASSGKNVVVIGGGSIGCETAEFLAKQGKKVSVIEMTDTFAGNTGKTAQTILLGHLKGNGVKLLAESRVEKITATEVIYKAKDGKQNSVKADTVVLAIGNRPDTSLYNSLKDEVNEIYNIGDSNGGGIIPNAVYDGYTVGNKI